MSSIGMNLNIYDTTGHYLTLLNDFSVVIKEDPEKMEEENYEQVKNLFLTLESNESINPEIQLLSIIIEQELRKDQLSPTKFFKAITKDLQSRTFEKVISNLERVIKALDSEFSFVLSKMNGST